MIGSLAMAGHNGVQNIAIGHQQMGGGSTV